MNPRIAFIVLPLFLLVLNTDPAGAAWSGPREIISGQWGAGAGQFGLRSEGGLSVLPSIETITPEKLVIISDPVNRKQMVFGGEGKLINEVKWDAAKGSEEKAIVPMSQKDREAVMVQSLKIASSTFRITVVFPDKNVVFDSDIDFKAAARDVNGFIYGTTANRVVRFDKNGKKTADLIVPNSREELVPVPGHRAPSGVYIIYGEPVVAPNGDVYVWQKSDEKYSVLKWTWQE